MSIRRSLGPVRRMRTKPSLGGASSSQDAVRQFPLWDSYGHLGAPLGFAGWF